MNVFQLLQLRFALWLDLAQGQLTEMFMGQESQSLNSPARREEQKWLQYWSLLL